jgi:hypothetical protein
MTALWGARSVKQMEDVQEAYGWKLTADDYAEIDRILEETITDPVGPEFLRAAEQRKQRPVVAKG